MNVSSTVLGCLDSCPSGSDLKVLLERMEASDAPFPRSSTEWALTTIFVEAVRSGASLDELQSFLGQSVGPENAQLLGQSYQRLRPRLRLDQIGFSLPQVVDVRCRTDYRLGSKDPSFVVDIECNDGHVDLGLTLNDLRDLVHQLKDIKTACQRQTLQS